MFNTQTNEKFLRDDIYYCNCCGKFFSEMTDEEVQVPFEEMPAALAIQVMADRQNSEKDDYKTQRSSRRKPRGFGKRN
jgi:hypothetical protein